MKVFITCLQLKLEEQQAKSYRLEPQVRLKPSNFCLSAPLAKARGNIKTFMTGYKPY
jgi:hypothetical protein